MTQKWTTRLKLIIINGCEQNVKRKGKKKEANYVIIILITIRRPLVFGIKIKTDVFEKFIETNFRRSTV